MVGATVKHAVRARANGFSTARCDADDVDSQCTVWQSSLRPRRRPALFGNAIEELTDRTVQLAKASADTQGGNWRARVNELLEMDAVNISYLIDDKDAAGWQMVEKAYAERTVPLLRKYGVVVPNSHGIPGSQPT